MQLESFIFVSRDKLYFLINNFIKGKETHLGFIYFILQEKFYSIIDVKEDCIFFEMETGKNLKLENNNLYNIQECVDFIKKRNDEGDDESYFKIRFENHAILHAFGMCETPSIQIMIFDDQCSMDSFKMQLLETENDKNVEMISNKIKEAVFDSKNISIIGSSSCFKEKYVNLFSNWFNPFDKIIILEKNLPIVIVHGIKETIKQNSVFVKNLSEKELNKIVPKNKQYDRSVVSYSQPYCSNDNYEQISKLAPKNRYFLFDLINFRIESLESNEEKDFNMYKCMRDTDLIVCLEDKECTGDIISKIYEKDDAVWKSFYKRNEDLII